MPARPGRPSRPPVSCSLTTLDMTQPATRRPAAIRVVALALGLFALVGSAQAQDRTGRAGVDRPPREYTSPDEIVSLTRDIPINEALRIISGISKKSSGRIIIDPSKNSQPIGVDIVRLPWRDALERILLYNRLWYQTNDDFYQIIADPNSVGLAGPPQPQSGTVSPSPIGGGGSARADGATTSAGGVPTVINPYNIDTREVVISAVFFEANLAKLNEVGVNWTAFKNNLSLLGGRGFISGVIGGAGPVTDSSTFQIAAGTTGGDIDATAILRLFEANNLGEVITSPEVTVRSGEQGRIQIGADYSIKTRDFSGNVVDNFISTGTIIQVIPTVVREDSTDFIHLALNVERSSASPDAISTRIDKTQAKTSVLLLNGEETVLGGLYSNDEQHIRRGIPILKDLPWYVFGLRYLFGYDRTQILKRELVIVVRARLVPTLAERRDEGVTNRPGSILDRETQQFRDDLRRYRPNVRKTDMKIK